MDADRKRPAALAIVGPTAVGKTAFSLRLAQAFGGEIVNADASAFYREMNIGTAKPGPEERAAVPHHLVDIADPDEVISLGDFQELAYGVIDQLVSAGRLPIVVGGSGQYIRALTEGYNIPPVAPDDTYRQALEKLADSQGGEVLFDRLRAVDPVAAERIDGRNIRRVIRALEVHHLSGKPISSFWAGNAPRFDFLVLGFIRDRETLYARIDQRIERMLAGGLVEEVRGLLAKGYDPGLPSFSAIGYRQVAAMLAGKMERDEAVREMQQLTRQLVRRQSNWFPADDPEIRWFDLAEAGVQAEMIRYVAGRLA